MEIAPAERGPCKKDSKRFMSVETNGAIAGAHAEYNLSSSRETVIQPSSGWAALNVAEVWLYRNLLITLAMRDIKLRYRQTALGVIWVVLQPLIAAGIFAFVFGRVGKFPSDGIPYFLFSFAGLLGWNIFNNTLTKSSTSLIGNAQLVSKIYFPRLILPLSTVFSTLIDFAVSFVMMVALMCYYHVTPHAGILLLPVWLILILALATGFGLIAGALAVPYRDVQYVLPVLTQFIMYASPVAYAVSAVPQHLRMFYFLNPLSGLLEGMRWSLLGRGHVTWQSTVYASVFAIVLFVAGVFTFRRMERRLADVI